MPVIFSTSAFSAGAQPNLNTTDIATRWRADYALNLAMLTYIGGYEHIAYRQSYFSALAANSTYNYREHPETVNQEIRLASSTGGRINWLVGGYYVHEGNRPFDYTLRHPLRRRCWCAATLMII